MMSTCPCSLPNGLVYEYIIPPNDMSPFLTSVRSVMCMSRKEVSMPYIVTPLAAKVRQIHVDDILNNTVDLEAVLRSRQYAQNDTFTRTWYYPYRVPFKYYRDLGLDRMISSLREWNHRHADLFERDRQSMYTEFRIPKASGGFRTIDAPCDELKEALRQLKFIFESIYNPLYHTSAFAYIKKRSALDAVKRHQFNASWWFLKTDFSNFFGSTDQEFVTRMLSDIFPFSEVMNLPVGREQLERALDLCFLNGGLPQGTPISPFLTNVIMIPIDFRFARDFRNNNGDLFDGNHFVYTRYADDMNISCKGSFMFQDVLAYMRGVLDEFGAPYELKQEKTHYGSRAGRNWIHGLMLNKDNEITIGSKKKRTFRSMCHNFANHRDEWELGDMHYMLGLVSYYRNVEPSFITSAFEKCRQKYGFDIEQELKDTIAGRIV